MNGPHAFIKRDLAFMYASSLGIAVIMAVVSIVGILYWDILYPTSQAVGSVGSDLFNIVAVLPILLVSMWFARRGSFIALLLWPGVLFYVLYIYVFNIIGLPVTVLFLPYVLLVVLSAYTIIGLVASADGDAARQRLAGVVPRRAAGGVLIALSILFIAMDAYAVITTSSSHTTVDIQTRATWIVDFVVECPALLFGGVLLWHREAPGYMASTGLLFQIGALLFAVPVGAALGAVLTGSPVDMSSAMLLMIGIIPIALLALIMLGVKKSTKRLNIRVDNHE